MNKTNKNADFQSAVWARENSEGYLDVGSGILPLQMKNSDGTAQPLVLLNGFGADQIRFEASKGVQMHTHEGDHILVVVSGYGVLQYKEDVYQLNPGFIYLVPGNVPHGITAKTELSILAIGNKHYPADSLKRMTPTGVK